MTENRKAKEKEITKERWLKKRKTMKMKNDNSKKAKMIRETEDATRHLFRKCEWNKNNMKGKETKKKRMISKKQSKY